MRFISKQTSAVLLVLSSTKVVHPIFAKLKISTKTGFSTIRPMTLMKKEKEDLPNRSAFREQMGNYKKLRQEHRRTMLELETKLEKEMENHQRNLQNELHRQRRKHDDDR